MTAILFLIILILVLSIPSTFFIIYNALIPKYTESVPDFHNPHPVNLDQIYDFHEAFYWPHIFWELAGRIILDGE